MLDAHHVVEVALVPELGDDHIVFLKVIVAEILHQEESLTHLPIRWIRSVSAGREVVLELLAVVRLLEAHIGWLVTVLLHGRSGSLDWLSGRLQDSLWLRLNRCSLDFFSNVNSARSKSGSIYIQA